MHYRVFGGNESAVEPQGLLKELQERGFEVQTALRGDEQGWFHADLLLAGEDEPIKIERYLATEEGIRTELHTWIAWLETVAGNPHQDRLIRHLVATRQVFTILQPPVDDPHDPIVELCGAVCRYLASATDGVYQVDNEGFFDFNGELLVMED